MILKKMKSVFLYSSVGRKALLGITGMGLAGFILIHLAGNLLLFAGPKAYNLYSHKLIDSPFIFLVEFFLLAGFAVHILWALALAWSNRNKKGPEGVADPDAKIIHKTLWAQGLVILLFVVLHLITFKYGAYYEAQYDGLKVRDLFRLVFEVFQKPLYVLWYLAALGVISFHLNHGLEASLRSLGVFSSSSQSLVRNLSRAYALIVFLGFSSQPLYFFLFYSAKHPYLN